MDRKEYQKQYHKKLREARREQGLCVYCGKQEAEEGYTNCTICREKKRVGKWKPSKEKRNEYTRKHYQKMKEQGICRRCCKPIEEGCTSTVYCENCKNTRNEKLRIAYKEFQEMRICPRCKKMELLGDEKVCLECSAKQYTNTVIRYRENGTSQEKLAYDREYGKRLRLYRYDNALCTRCGKQVKDIRYAMCGICRAKYRERKRENAVNHKAMWEEQGLCKLCGGERYENYKVCKDCYDRIWKCSHSEAANEARKTTKLVWR